MDIALRPNGERRTQRQPGVRPARLIMSAAGNGNGTGTMKPPAAESGSDSADEEAPPPKQQNPKLHNILQHGPRITILDPVRACTAVSALS